MNRLIIQNKLFNHFQMPDYLPIRRWKQIRRPHISHPALWYEDYPISLIGCRQSPINIKRKQCILNDQKLQLSSLKIQYPASFSGLRLRNPKDDTYFGWRIDIPYHFGDQASGPLHYRYKLTQFHAHWGKDCHCGSEHIIDGKSYAAELHFVHWNYDLYSSARTAAISKDGLTVLAVFLQVVNEENDTFKHLDSLDIICNEIPDIKYKGSVKHIKKQLDILELYPKNRSYFTYLGSLTTPPLWETVTWIIFENPILCTKRQVDVFRKLSYYQKERTKMGYLDEIYNTNIMENTRPVQPLNNRQVIYVKQK